MNSSRIVPNILDSAYTQVGSGRGHRTGSDVERWRGGAGGRRRRLGGGVHPVRLVGDGGGAPIATSGSRRLSGRGPVGTPHAASWGVGDTDVFWRGSDGGLWHEVLQRVAGPQELSRRERWPPIRTPFPGARQPRGLLRGTDGNLWQVDYINGWQGPADLGFGPLDSVPTRSPGVSATSTSSGKGPTEALARLLHERLGTVLSRWATRSRLPPIPTRSPGAPGTSTSSGRRLRRPSASVLRRRMEPAGGSGRRAPRFGAPPRLGRSGSDRGLLEGH